MTSTRTRNNCGSNRILLVSPEPFFEPRGTPINVRRMCRLLAKAGYLIDLVTYPLGEPLSIPGVQIHRSSGFPGIRTVSPGFSRRKLVLDFFLALKVYSLLLRRRYDLVHAVEEAVFIVLPATWAGVALVYDLDSVLSDQLHDSDVIRSPRLMRMARHLERIGLNRACAALTVCRSITETVRRVAPATRIFEIEDAPLEEATRPADPAQVDALRAELGLGQRPAIVYTGNLESYQGIDLLLEAAALVRRDCPDAALVLVGGDGDRLEKLSLRIKQDGLGPTVFAMGRRAPEEMPEWMGLADVLVSPRTKGVNTPLKIYTYMCSGKPIVATRVPTHCQVLDDDSAVLCDPTPEALADGIRRTLRDPQGAKALAAEARRRVDAQYGHEAFERKLLGAYQAILGAGEVQMAVRRA